MSYEAGRQRFGPGSSGDGSGRKKKTESPKPDKKKMIPPTEEEPEEEIDLKGFQVVRREFFAHTREPSIVFNDGKISVNTACVRRFPEVEYVQILINREKQQMAIRPCEEMDLFSFRWGTTKEGKRYPKAPAHPAAAGRRA